MNMRRKPLDPVVKVGIGVFLGSFVLIGIGMFLSRPDRSIPPFSVGSQEGTVVAINLPPWTSDPEIEALIRRFRTIREKTHDFGPMKIRPTTPTHPVNRYQQLTIYIFSDHRWTTPEMLGQYLHAPNGQSDERTFKTQFESSVRGGYHLDATQEKGWIGPIVHPGEPTPPSLVRWLFKETFKKEVENG